MAYRWGLIYETMTALAGARALKPMALATLQAPTFSA